MPKKLAGARFWFQGNAFCPIPTTHESFRAREWRAGDQAIAAARGIGSELEGRGAGLGRRQGARSRQARQDGAAGHDAAQYSCIIDLH